MGLGSRKSVSKEIEGRRTGPVATSISCGVAACRPDEPLEQAVERADAALLEAKRRGRNLVFRSVA